MDTSTATRRDAGHAIWRRGKSTGCFPSCNAAATAAAESERSGAAIPTQTANSEWRTWQIWYPEPTAKTPDAESDATTSATCPPAAANVKLPKSTSPAAAQLHHGTAATVYTSQEQLAAGSSVPGHAPASASPASDSNAAAVDASVCHTEWIRSARPAAHTEAIPVVHRPTGTAETGLSSGTSTAESILSKAAITWAHHVESTPTHGSSASRVSGVAAYWLPPGPGIASAQSCRFTHRVSTADPQFARPTVPSGFNPLSSLPPHTAGTHAPSTTCTIHRLTWSHAHPRSTSKRSDGSGTTDGSDAPSASCDSRSQRDEFWCFCRNPWGDSSTSSSPIVAISKPLASPATIPRIRDEHIQQCRSSSRPRQPSSATAGDCSADDGQTPNASTRDASADAKHRHVRFPL